jgi:hypothetical protein
MLRMVAWVSIHVCRVSSPFPFSINMFGPYYLSQCVLSEGENVGVYNPYVWLGQIDGTVRDIGLPI